MSEIERLVDILVKNAVDRGIILSDINISYITIYVQNVLGVGPMSGELERSDYIELFVDALDYDMFYVAEKMHETFNFTLEEFKSDFSLFSTAQLIRLETLEWLRITFNWLLTEAEIEKLFHIGFVRDSDMVTILEYLKSTPGYNLTEEVIKSGDNVLFREAVNNNYMLTLNWIDSNYGITLKDARSNDNQAFISASVWARTKLLKWLHEKVNYTAEDARCRNNSPIIASIPHGDMYHTRWMQDTFKFTVEDIRSQNNAILKRVCKHMNLTIIEWMMRTYALEMSDFIDIPIMSSVVRVFLVFRYPELHNILMSDPYQNDIDEAELNSENAKFLAAFNRFDRSLNKLIDLVEKRELFD